MRKMWVLILVVIGLVVIVLIAAVQINSVRLDRENAQVDGQFEPTPWTGYFRNYQTRDGLSIPLEGEVMWDLPEGDLAYWRGQLDKIEYEAGEDMNLTWSK